MINDLILIGVRTVKFTFIAYPCSEIVPYRWANNAALTRK